MSESEKIRAHLLRRSDAWSRDAARYLVDDDLDRSWVKLSGAIAIRKEANALRRKATP